MFINNPLVIVVNGQVVQPGTVVKVVHSFEIQHIPVGIFVPKGQGKIIADWVYDLVQRCESDYIVYNGTLILKDEVKPFTAS